MKAARFDYHCAASVADACEALASHEDARLIAGGQTLVPMMAMRLARPALLVDIARGSVEDAVGRWILIGLGYGLNGFLLGAVWFC